MLLYNDFLFSGLSTGGGEYLYERFLKYVHIPANAAIKTFKIIARDLLKTYIKWSGEAIQAVKNVKNSPSQDDDIQK